MVQKKKLAKAARTKKADVVVMKIDDDTAKQLSLVEDKVPKKAEEMAEEKAVKKAEEKVPDIPDTIDDEVRLERLRIAGTGVIPDPRVFRMMYLEKCALEAALQIQVRKSAYESRMQALKAELNNVVRQWEDTQRKSIRKISDVRREVEEDYGIHMNQWGYDEDTGVLKRIPEEALQEIKNATEGKEAKITNINANTPDG